jgi:hypothetical protein
LSRKQKGFQKVRADRDLSWLSSSQDERELKTVLEIRVPESWPGRWEGVGKKE